MCVYLGNRHIKNISRSTGTRREYLPSIYLINIDDHAELNSAKKYSREGKPLLFYGHVVSIKLNPITSSLNYCFVKVVVIQQTRINENLYSVWACIHDDDSVLTGECGCLACLISPCKHVFAILHYI